MIGMMFDGLLRSVEMAAVRRQDVSRFSDGSGRLLVPYSKTDPLGNGEVTYVSGRTMEYSGQDERVEAYARTCGDGR